MGDVHAIEGAGSRPVPGMGLARARPAPGHAEETWVLQSDAAARTGFSVSAIRKWRRMGLVAERKVTSPNGLERVEVKLEDAMARAALQPDRRRPETADSDVDATASPGSVIMAVIDLQAIFERMVEAERRADVAEAELRSLQARARFTFGQLAELRRQLQATAAPAPSGLRPADPRPLGEPQVQGSPAPRTAIPGAAPAPVSRSPESLPPRVAPPPARRPPVRPVAAPSGPSVAELFGRLQRIYGRLDEYRREPGISPATERQRQRELSDYDGVLVAVCDAIDIPTGSGDGRPLTIENRAALTHALARAGLDVRAGVQGPPLRSRLRRPGARPH